MPSPFPGMDPYLEHPDRWTDVHTRLMVELGNVLAERLRPRYVVAVEQRTFIQQPDELVFIGRPDVTVAESGAAERGASGEDASAPTAGTGTVAAAPRVVTIPLPEERHERYLEMREVSSGRVVTVLELLSPTNKHRGAGRRGYLNKRRQVLAGRTHLVEIDLVRGGRRPPIEPEPRADAYCILVSRAGRRPRADLYEFGLRDPIPVFPLPLAPQDPEPEVSLRAVLDTVYDRAGFDLRIDYDTPPVPPFAPADADWARAQLASARRS
ncbi:MAG: DUF4058 family protein [Planctomycetes bacterium]|nr:DUF4058 family protein [Planctomycetota bacterium]